MFRAFPVLICKTNAAAQTAARGVTGLPTKPSSRLSNMFARTERSSVPSSAALKMQDELPSARRQDPSRGPGQPGALQTATGANGHSKGPGSNGRDDPSVSNQEPLSTTMRAAPGRWSKSRTIAQCFLRLSNVDPTLLDRVGAYEARLWRQAAQTIWTLEAMRRPPPPIRQRLRHRVAPFTWDRQR